MRRIDLYETRRWLEIADPGDEGIYWTGLLPVDRAGNRKLFMTASALWRLSTVTSLYRTQYTRKSDMKGAGCVMLFQRRAFVEGFDYIVRSIRKPSSAELDLAFSVGRFER
jgi:hypothetical protein